MRAREGRWLERNGSPGRSVLGRLVSLKLACIFLMIHVLIAPLHTAAQTHPEYAHTNLYEALGLNPNATPADVKKAYRTLALKNHPDKVKVDDKEAAASVFAEIAEAYEILSDPVRRKQYDLARKQVEEASNLGKQGRDHHHSDRGFGYEDHWDEDVEAWSAQGRRDPNFAHQDHGRDEKWVFTDPFQLFESFFADTREWGDLRWGWDHEAAGYAGYPSGNEVSDWESAVYEDIEWHSFGGQDFIRIQRVYGDGRIEMETKEAPSSSSGRARVELGGRKKTGEWAHEERREHKRDSFERFHRPFLSSWGTSTMGVARQALRTGERLKVGDQLLSPEGTHVCFLDHKYEKLVVAENLEDGDILWESNGRGEGWETWEEGDSLKEGARPHSLHENHLSAVVSRQGRVEIWREERVGSIGGRKELVWQSTQDAGGPSVDEDLSSLEYVLTLSDVDGNLALYCVAKEGRALGDEDGEEECVWASRGCPGMGRTARQALGEFGRQVVFPVFRLGVAGFTSLLKQLRAFVRDHGFPNLRRGWMYVYRLTKKAASKLRHAVAERRRVERKKQSQGRGSGSSI
ncbi:hypothetical protein NSK_004125 [Nannochloropsis salina CCMP1776]|uniref:J domain-containing protein n=1 Tax=Nannochloropsis salina CCMP1776 TaxID=1027361 RepID=A0A4D9CZ49_9STRA|nr:hypothetical protein NSK_004125 [Nannochloropsis salina CCMP1776]|eukprot:TFJ84661.1 hypothetical protein NSK_004125 [Nannochloropsis salina CCMP1776]